MLRILYHGLTMVMHHSKLYHLSIDNPYRRQRSNTEIESYIRPPYSGIPPYMLLLSPIIKLHV